MFEKLVKRFSEPSTYAGLAGLALLAGINAEEFSTYANAFAGVFGFISIILAEKNE